MKSYTNYLYYNYCHCIDNFTKIIDDLIKGELLPKDMDEETHNKMNEWFGPDWSYIFGYKTCDKNYSKPKLTQSDPIYKFIIVSVLKNNVLMDTLLIDKEIVRRDHK